MQRRARLAITVALVLVVVGCRPSGPASKEAPAAPLQVAAGKEYEVVISAPSEQLAAVRRVFDSVFAVYYPMLNRPEWWFTPTYIPLKKLSPATRRHHTLFLVWTHPPRRVPGFLADVIDTAEIKDIFQHPGRYHIYTDLWAKGQQVWLWPAASPERLREEALQAQSAVIKKLDAHQESRIAGKLYRNGWRKDFARRMLSQWGYSLRIPTVFSVDKVVEHPRPPFTHFFWARTETKKSFSNIIGWGIHPAPDSFTLDSFIRWHDTMGRRYIPGPSVGSYFATERAFVDGRPVQHADWAGYEVRGLWRVENDFMGGPFVAYVIPAGDSVIVVEGFLHAPGTFQKRFMKRLEVILNTFKR